MTEPTLRKPLGILAMLLWIAVWSVLAVSFGNIVLALSWPVQVAFFAIAGVAWIAPLRPLLIWMETGRLRP